MRWVITNKILAAIPKKKARNNWTNQQISNIITLKLWFWSSPVAILVFFAQNPWTISTAITSTPMKNNEKQQPPKHSFFKRLTACAWFMIDEFGLWLKNIQLKQQEEKNTVLVKHGWLREKTKQPWQWYNLYSSSLCSQQLVPGSHLRMVCRVEQWHKDLMCPETQWIPCKSSYIISFYIVIHWSFHHQEVINNNWRFPRFGPQYQWGEVQSWCGSLIARNGLLSTIWLRKQYLATSTGASLMRCITRFHK